MLDIQFAQTEKHKTAYCVFGDGKISVVIEMALGAVMGEWWHIAEKLSAHYTVLLYERAGCGMSEPSSSPRTSMVIASELKQLLDELPHEESVILLAHSQGGLYAQQFARLYPHMVKGLILLDPLSAHDNRFKELLTPEEFKKSGVDKFSNLGLQRTLAKLHFGFLIKALMKSAPPFYYCKDFSADAQEYILNALTKPSLYETAMEEYQQAHMDENIANLRQNKGFPDIPLVLITHSSALAVQETMDFGGANKELAEKVETIWQDLMKEYLAFSPKSQYIQAEKSTHYIHLTQPELLGQALEILEQGNI